MKLNILLLFVILLTPSFGTAAQVPTAIGIQILKAEDARRYDDTLEKLIKDPNLAVRNRAALAAGRIGDERAIPALVELLENEAAINRDRVDKRCGRNIENAGRSPDAE